MQKNTSVWCVCVCVSQNLTAFFFSLELLDWRRWTLTRTKEWKKKLRYTRITTQMSTHHIVNCHFLMPFFGRFYLRVFIFSGWNVWNQVKYIRHLLDWFISNQKNGWFSLFIFTLMLFFCMNVVGCGRMFYIIINHTRISFFLRAQWELKECLQHTQVAVNSKTGPIWWSPPPSTASIYSALRCTFFLFQFILLCSFV